MRMTCRLSLALLAAILLSLVASSPAMALCYAECPSGDSCTGRPVCCCVDGIWAYCGPIAGNPCFAAASTQQSEQEAALKASYDAIFAAAPSSSPEAVSTDSK